MTEELQRGVIPLARYQDQQLPEYQENPLISTLPPILDMQEVVGRLQQFPSFEPQEVLLNGRLRVHAIYPPIAQLLPAAEPPLGAGEQDQLDDSSGLHRSESASGAWYAHLQNGYRRIEEEDLDTGVYQSVSSGQQPVVVRLLRLWQDAHVGADSGDVSPGSPSPRLQHHTTGLLKIDCPIDGDLDELCLSFFNEVDKILGTHYSRSHGRKKLGTTGHRRQVTACASIWPTG